MGLGLVRVGPGRDEAYAAGSVLADLGFTRGPEDEYAYAAGSVLADLGFTRGP